MQDICIKPVVRLPTRKFANTEPTPKGINVIMVHLCSFAAPVRPIIEMIKPIAPTT